MKWLTLVILIPCLSGCEQAMNKLRSDPCTMSLVDECKATLANGEVVSLTAYSYDETEVPHDNNLDECHKAAREHAYAGPTSFFTNSTRVMAANAVQPNGEFIIAGKGELQFHYKKTGQADYQNGDEAGAMVCTSQTRGSIHDL